MAFCPSCGSKLDDGTKFCPSCGAAQEVTANTYANTSDTQNQGINIVDSTSSFDKKDIEDNKIVCALAYISILFFLPLVASPESRFGKFHANQALVLLIATAILGTVGSVVTQIWLSLPFIPEFVRTISGALLGMVLSAVPIAGMVFGIVNAAQGKAAELPLIGKYNLLNK